MYQLHSVDVDNYDYDLKLKYVDGRIVGKIPKDWVQSLTLKFNDVSSMDLKIPKYVTNITGRTIKNNIYDKITTNKLITLNTDFCFYIDGNINYELENTEFESKTLTCYTTDKKLETQQFDFGTSATYQLKQDNVNQAKGLIDYFVEDTYINLNYIDPTAYKESINGGTSNKYRWIDSGNKMWGQHLLDFKNAFKCLFLFNTYEDTFSVYSEENIGKFNGLYLSFDNFVKKLVKKVNNDNVFTRIFVDGGSNQDKVDISEVNPTGKSYIEKFSIYYDEMPDNLVSALKKYDEIVDNKYTEWLVIKNQISDLQTSLNTINTNLTSLSEALKAQEDEQKQFIKLEDDLLLTPVTTEIKRLEGLISSNIAQKTYITSQITEKDKQIADIASYLEKSTCKDSNGNLIFTKDMLRILKKFTKDGTYQNEYYLTSQGLYDDAISKMTEIQTPIMEFETEVVSFVDNVRCPQGNWNKVLRLGDWVLVEIGDKEKVRCRLIEIQHSPQKGSSIPTLKLTFSNKPYKYDDIKMTSPISEGVKAKSTLNSSANRWDNFQEGVDFAKNVYENGLNLSAQKVQNRYDDVSRITIDNGGILVQDAQNLDEAVYVGNGIISFSGDGFLTSSTAIDKNGIIAKHIVGKMILGEKLSIADATGLFQITGSGLKIFDENGVERIFLGLENQNGVKKAILKLMNSDNTKTILSEKGVISSDSYTFSQNLDKNHPINQKFYIPDNASSIYQIKLALSLDPFRADSSTSAVSGGITSTTSENGGGGTTTSEDGGGVTSAISSKAQKWNNFDYTTDGGEVDFAVEQIPPYGIDGIRIQYEKFGHYHISDISFDPHHHNVSFDPHHHNVSLDISHHHDLVFGIYENGNPTNVKVYIDGNMYNTTIIDDCYIDLTNIISSGTGWKNLKVTSNTIGRISGTLFVQYFASI